MKGYIYTITNKINNMTYIGSTINYKSRSREHINGLKNNKHSNHHLQKSANKYGYENFKIEILYESDNFEDILELRYLEEKYIKIFKTAHSEIGYNLTETTIAVGAKKIIQIDDDGNIIEIFESLASAEDYLDLRGNTPIRQAISGFDRDNKCQGYRWQYWNGEDYNFKFNKIDKKVYCLYNEEGILILKSYEKIDITNYLDIDIRDIYPAKWVTCKNTKRSFYKRTKNHIMLTCKESEIKNEIITETSPQKMFCPTIPVCSINDDGTICKIYDSFKEAHNNFGVSTGYRIRVAIDGINEGVRWQGLRWAFYEENLTFKKSYTKRYCIVDKEGYVINHFTKAVDIAKYLNIDRKRVAKIIRANKIQVKTRMYDENTTFMEIMSCDLDKKQDLLNG